MIHTFRLLLLGTACGLCFIAQAAGATQAIDTAKLENGFTAGCLRQDTDCFFQHVQWQSLQSYTTHEVLCERCAARLI